MTDICKSEWTKFYIEAIVYCVINRINVTKIGWNEELLDSWKVYYLFLTFKLYCPYWWANLIHPFWNMVTKWTDLTFFAFFQCYSNTIDWLLWIAFFVAIHQTHLVHYYTWGGVLSFAKFSFSYDKTNVLYFSLSYSLI